MHIGRSRSAAVIAAMVFLGLCLGSADLSGQIGGLLKKKAKDIVNQPDAGKSAESTTAPAKPAPVFNDTVLELNADTVARLQKALACEKDSRTKIEASFPKEDEYQNCMIKTQMSPEAQAIATGKNNDPNQMMKQLMALYEQKCGKSPNSRDKGAELKSAKEEGLKCGGFTQRQYTVAKERIAPFCNSGGQEKVKGFGNLYYVYTPAEVSAIKPECSKLLSLINAVDAPPKN